MLPTRQPSKRFLADIASFRRRDAILRLGVSDIHDVGVFLKVPVRASDFVEVETWHGHTWFENTVENIGPCTVHPNCVIYLSNDFGEFINHYQYPNCQFVYGDDAKLRLYFLEDIQAGVELTVDYGPTYQVDGVTLVRNTSADNPTTRRNEHLRNPS